MAVCKEQADSSSMHAHAGELERQPAQQYAEADMLEKEAAQLKAQAQQMKQRTGGIEVPKHDDTPVMTQARCHSRSGSPWPYHHESNSQGGDQPASKMTDAKDAGGAAFAQQTRFFSKDTKKVIDTSHAFQRGHSTPRAKRNNVQQIYKQADLYFSQAEEALSPRNVCSLQATKHGRSKEKSLNAGEELMSADFERNSRLVFKEPRKSASSVAAAVGERVMVCSGGDDAALDGGVDFARKTRLDSKRSQKALSPTVTEGTRVIEAPCEFDDMLANFGTELEGVQPLPLKNKTDEGILASQGKYTTLKLCNIPCRRRIGEVVDVINVMGGPDSYNLLYLPIRQATRMHKVQKLMGHAFVNFKTHQHAVEFEHAFNGFCFSRSESLLKCRAQKAQQQGYRACVQMLGKSSSNGCVIKLNDESSSSLDC